MAQSLEIVAQYAMDIFYSEYKEDSGFFVLEDFVFHCGKEAADYLRQEYQRQYDELRQEKEDGVIDFSDDWLSYDTLDVVNQNGSLYVQLINPIFSVPYDSQNVGLQDVSITKPNGSCVQMERTTGGALWRLKYLPVVNDRIFWWLSGMQINFYNPGRNNIQQVQIEYVPSISKLSNVPDAIVDIIITNAVNKMNMLMQKKIIKKSLDGNQNLLLEAEIDKKQLQ